MLSLKTFIRIRATFVFVGICLFSLFLLGACTERTHVPPPSTKSLETQTPEPVSKTINAAIYIDSSGSMEGFVTRGSETFYKLTLKIVRSVIKSGWDINKFSAYKFGENVRKIDESEYVKALTPSFYKGQESSKSTKIDGVFEEKGICEPNSLAVVVTDLFQNRADLQSVLDRLKQRCLMRNYSIGVVGVKGQFDGNVCEVGERNNCFPYTELNRYERFRPFYLLVLGKHSDIVKFMESLIQLCSFIRKEHLSLFSPSVVDPVGSFEGVSYDDLKGLAEVTSIVTQETPNNRIMQFLIRKDNASVVLTPKINWVPFTPELDMTKLAFEATYEKHFLSEGFRTISEGARAFPVEVMSAKDRKRFTLKMGVSSSDLPGKGIYRCGISVRPSRSGYIIPEWWSSWNMNMTKIDSWKKTPHSFEGSTTANLSLFLQSLLLTNREVNKPEVAKLYFYFQRN